MMKKGWSILLAVLLFIGGLVPVSAASEFEFETFSIVVGRTGSVAPYIRLIVSTTNFPFAITATNQLEGCLLNGTVTYAGTDERWSKSVPFENVKVARSEVRTGATAIDFVVPNGYTIDPDYNTQYTWNLTLSPRPLVHDIPETGSTFFVTPDMFAEKGGWSHTTDGVYDILFSGSSAPGESTSVNVVVPESGTYGIFSLTKDYATNSPGTRYAKIEVKNTTLALAGKHGNNGYAWEKIGEMTLTKDEVIPVRYAVGSAAYSRNAGIMFTTEQDYRPATETLKTTFHVGKAEKGYAMSDSFVNLLYLADDFSSDLGTWTTTTNDGYNILYGMAGGATPPADATALITIPSDGTYYVWGFSKDYTSNNQGARACKLGVNGNVLDGWIGVHGAETDTGPSGGYGWDLAGRVNLKQGTVTLSAIDLKKNYARLAAVLLTTDPDFSNRVPLSDAMPYEAEATKDILDFSGVVSYGNKLSFTLKNRTENALCGKLLMAAVFNGEGRLVDVKTVGIDRLDAFESMDKTSIVFEASDNWDNGKILLWDNETLRPETDPILFSFVQEDYAAPDEGADANYGTVTSYMLNYEYKNPAYVDKEYNVRDGIYNTLKKLESGEDVTVAYLGGSITQQASWRPKTTQWLEENFAGQIAEVNIGLSGTNADLAVCRIDQEILVHDPDLIFIEYAVNGGAAKDMEGMARKVWAKNPQTDICFVYTTTTGYYQTYREGNLPPFPAVYEPVANHYGIPSVFFGYQAFDLYEQNLLTLAGTKEEGKVLYTGDGIHLTADGGFLAAGAIARMIEKQRKDFDAENYSLTDHIMPTQKYTEIAWEAAGSTDAWEKMQFDGTWMDCSLDESNSFRNFPYTGGYLGEFKKLFPKLQGTTVPGSSVTVKFRGTDIGVFEAGGQFSGQLRVIVDGVEQTGKLMLYNNNDSKLRHQYYFIPSLPYGEHTVTFILDSVMPDKSTLKNKYPTDENYDKNEFYLGRILYVGEILDIHS